MIYSDIHRKIAAKTMSQKRITSFFQQPKSYKRKFNDSNCENSAPLDTVKKSSTECFSSDKQSQIEFLELASIKPALKIGRTWYKELEGEFKSSYFKELDGFLKTEMARYTVYPPAQDIFSWTKSVDIHDVQVVILGQDPYIRPDQAHGLAFSVRKGVDIPKSLKNMYAELVKDVPNFVPPSHGCLNGWASQGVLLLNTCLTVRAGKSDSHKGKGWERFTDAVIKWINQNLKHVVFMLWGNNAKEKAKLISKEKHLILSAAHPSPLSASRGFFGCRHFSKANDYLKNHNKKGIDWKNLP